MKKFSQVHLILGARVAQSVYRLTTGWMTEESKLESWKAQEFLLFQIIQTILWPTQPLIHLVPRVLVPKSRISAFIQPLSHMPS
jgi:hypothetical protein